MAPAAGHPQEADLPGNSCKSASYGCPFRADKGPAHLPAVGVRGYEYSASVGRYGIT